MFLSHLFTVHADTPLTLSSVALDTKRWRRSHSSLAPSKLVYLVPLLGAYSTSSCPHPPASLNGVHLSFNLLDIISYCHVRAGTRQPTRIGRGFRLLNHQAPDTYPYHTTPSLPPSSIHPPGRPLRHTASALFLLPLSYHVLSTFWTAILSLVS
jgi:hypothetical protein